MSNKSIGMIQIRRIIQLKAQGQSKHRISITLPIHRATLDGYLLKVEATGKSYNELLQQTDQQLQALVFDVPTASNFDERFETLKQQLPIFVAQLSGVGVTRKTLWEEYIQSTPNGYAYTQFCEYFSRHMQCNRATMHLTHRAGEYLQIDFAGKPLRYIDNGQIIICPVLVCTLPYSGYAYVEALPSAKGEHMFAALNRCLEYLGGVTRNVLSDNMKQFVNKNQRYEYTFAELASQWAVHYNTNLDATRVRKPKDKPSVENSVYQSYLRIYAKLRNEEFFSLVGLNHRIHELLNIHNRTPFQKLPGSRLERFLSDEKPLLTPLPLESFTIKNIAKAKVQMNYHVILGQDNRQYSVPYQYIGQTTKIIYDLKNVEIYINFRLIALHERNYSSQIHTTNADHMPPNHLKYIETQGWDATHFISIATKIGPHSVDVFTKLLASKKFVEQTYKACIGMKRLAEIYGNTRFEAACGRSLNGGSFSYATIKNILANNLDKKNEAQPLLFTLPDHENIRGSVCYN